MANPPITKIVKADRSRWLRGMSGRESVLQDDLGNACCVGIYLKACGVDSETLENQCHAQDKSVRKFIPKEARWLIDEFVNAWASTEDASTLYQTNDKNDGYSCPERKIKSIFRKHGVDFQISGEGHPLK